LHRLIAPASLAPSFLHEEALALLGIEPETLDEKRTFVTCVTELAQRIFKAAACNPGNSVAVRW
jgi:hypothetical protein